MEIRDRIVELRRVRAGDLLANEQNWRTHPEEQRSALTGILEEVGYVGAILARELEDGTLEILDGHLRAELTPDAIVPVLVIDVDGAEAAKVLATFDPLAAMAGADADKLDLLLRDIDTGSEGLQQMLSGLAEEHGLVPPDEKAGPLAAPTYVEQFGVIVICEDEAAQMVVYEKLTAEGYNCKVVVT